MNNFKFNTAKQGEIEAHLLRMDHLFIPRLSSYVKIDDYAQKIYLKANRFELYLDGALQGLLAFYENNKDVFITNLSLEPNVQGQGNAENLIEKLKKHCFKNSFSSIILEVSSENARALKFYKKLCFRILKKYDQKVMMTYRVK